MKKSLDEVFNPTWELASFKDFESARSFAIANGWRATPQRVQVRKVGTDYFIEPYEKDCGCPGLVRPF